MASGGNTSALAAAISIANGAEGSANVLAQALSQAVAQGANASAVSQAGSKRESNAKNHYAYFAFIFDLMPFCLRVTMKEPHDLTRYSCHFY